MTHEISAMYQDSEPEDVLSVLACTQKLIDTNERVLADLDKDRRDCKATIDDLRTKQEQVKAMLNDIRASSSSPQQRGGSRKTISIVKLL